MLWSKVPKLISEPVWVFAYGSLIFRPGFEFLCQTRSSVTGYARRFWQGSPDHRGTPEKPGRVVTLVQAAGQLCEGVAFEVTPEHESAALDYLDDRESGGYERLRLSVTLESSQTVQAWTWIAPADNRNFLGESTQQLMVEQILEAHGQSGANRDYVTYLARELERIGIKDLHVQELARWVREASS
jgi:cation transport protein ChaC